MTLNGESVSSVNNDGYICIDRDWQTGDSLMIYFEMPIRRVLAHTNVEDCAGKIALERGPIVYALEGADNDGTISDIRLADNTALVARHRADLLGGITVITDGTITAIPYYAWGHRGVSEMAVWLAYDN